MAVTRFLTFKKLSMAAIHWEIVYGPKLIGEKTFIKEVA